MPPCELCRDDGIAVPCGYCGVAVGGVSRTQPREQTRAELLAEADARMEAARLAAIAGVAVQTGAAAATGPPSTGAADSVSPTPRPASATRSRRSRRPTPSRRTSAQVDRDAEQAKRDQELREWWAALGTAVEGNLEAERDFLETLREDAND